MELVLFGIASGFTLFSALGVVLTRNIIYAALFLLAALLGVAGLFVLLYAEFLALVQVFIYGGAIIIVILFALMLTRTGDFQAVAHNRRAPIAAVVSLALFGVMAFAFTSDAYRYNSNIRGGIDMAALGRVLFEEWAVPFEIASLVLLVALVGAVVLARTADHGPLEDEPLQGDLEEADAPVRPGARRARSEGRELAGVGRRGARGGRR